MTAVQAVRVRRLRDAAALCAAGSVTPPSQPTNQCGGGPRWTSDQTIGDLTETDRTVVLPSSQAIDDPPGAVRPCRFWRVLPTIRTAHGLDHAGTCSTRAKGACVSESILWKTSPRRPSHPPACMKRLLQTPSAVQSRRGGVSSCRASAPANAADTRSLAPNPPPLHRSPAPQPPPHRSAASPPTDARYGRRRPEAVRPSPSTRGYLCG